ncbi:ABC transporter substrate-binding protein [Microvirga sp. VF16]|uniref:substrate-binding periplasmic protein n=1 Tax=Microvirga sp. VF16 TaxID=2807101 RepID=UPI00193D8997|nr:ABC transporter substrate-binding protein [Microvirga sp. VF16]QRM32285.1 amino acid ABC transporter substrate-binding protein [Microvirga sp. VF16]
MMKFKTLVSLAVLSTAFAAHGVAAQECTPKHSFKTVKTGTLTVALTNTPPYSLEKEGVSGIDGDILQTFANENCLKVEYEVFSYPAAVSAVQSGRADAGIGGFYRTAARAKVVALSNAVYLDQVAVVSKEGYDTVDALKGKKVGTVEGYSWVRDLEKLYDTKTYPSSLNLAQDVQAGRIDAGVEGFGAAVDLNKGQKIQIKLFQPDPRVKATTLATQTAFLMSRDNKSFSEAMNASLDAYRKNGVIAKVLTAYGLPTSAADVGENKEY